MEEDVRKESVWNGKVEETRKWEYPKNVQKEKDGEERAEGRYVSVSFVKIFDIFKYFLRDDIFLLVWKV
uniref:Uncharacterized protein n=1 Tax=Marseillevirus sp. TaxID=2809551 RepID=A0AA96EL86_9VIRU|nr:hypothetical protein MarFTMF_171 [Marseillevirus sp.]